MNTYDSDDELDRALFALELEEPPADLRASILAATVYRPQPALKAWEMWGLGLLCALLAWLLIAVARGQAPEAGSLAMYVDHGVEIFSQPKTLFWVAIGGGAAIWLSQMNLIAVPGAARAARR